MTAAAAYRMRVAAHPSVSDQTRRLRERVMYFACRMRHIGAGEAEIGQMPYSSTVQLVWHLGQHRLTVLIAANPQADYTFRVEDVTNLTAVAIHTHDSFITAATRIVKDKFTP